VKLVFFRNHYLSLDEKNNTYKILAGAIAHEVRGPICTINIACANFMGTSGEGEKFVVIKQQASKALSVIDSILLQVKYIDNSAQTKCDKQSLNECVYSAINDPYFSDEDRAHIETDLSDDFAVLADRILLVQVVTNLIKNSLWAIKASGRRKIRIGTRHAGASVYLTIYDEGIGISRNNQKKLFEPFFSRSKLGAGLGLAFSKLALKNMNGSIICESKEGEFTRFTIELPLAAPLSWTAANSPSPVFSK